MRFISEDTYKGKIKNPLSLNYYTYCEGNPVGNIDPSGNNKARNEEEYAWDELEGFGPAASGQVGCPPTPGSSGGGGGVWELKATERGNEIEKSLSKTEYKNWYNIGQENNGYFKAIDFQKGNNVVSLKTLDPRLPSYRGNGATNKVLDYLDKLFPSIKVDGNLANKILDVRIPQGTKNYFDMDLLRSEANGRGIELILKEFE